MHCEYSYLSTLHISDFDSNGFRHNLLASHMLSLTSATRAKSVGYELYSTTRLHTDTHAHRNNTHGTSRLLHTLLLAMDATMLYEVERQAVCEVTAAFIEKTPLAHGFQLRKTSGMYHAHSCTPLTYRAHSCTPPTYHAHSCAPRTTVH